MRAVAVRRAFTLSSVLLLLAPPLWAQTTTKELLKCQQTLEKESAKLVKARTKYLGGCVRELLACVVANEVDGEPLGPCQAEAVAGCNQALTSAANAATSFAAKVGPKCPIPDATLRSRRGLGFRDDAGACAALTPPGSVATTADALDCAARSSVCAADDRIEQIVPRAYEVLSAAGLAGSAPCIDVRGAAPAGAGATATKDLLGCQGAIEKGFVKVEASREKAIRKCTTALLKCDLPADRLESSIVGRNACRAKAQKGCNSQRAAVGKKELSRDATVLAKCGPVALADLKDRLGFGATCGAAGSIGDVATCLAVDLEARSERGVGIVTPRACALLRSAAQLTDYQDTCVPSCGNGVVEAGETCDDGNVDALDTCTPSCTPGPLDFETIVLPSTAAPANTPDGTPANAVPPGSTLATQFGSTIFDLNRAMYTRYFTPGAGDPDTVLILLPGFAGGAGDFRLLAENLIARAEADGQIGLEVWAYDRRSNLLEDTAGAETAEDELDGALALDWFFGGALGVPLDPRLSRRAVFHAGPDVAFMANFTPQVFARDIDAVVAAAHALPSAPAVFLGGHSLGTLFTGRYAATDFDLGPGVDPGYAKVDGLVLFEGGGGGVPLAPTSDDLDTVIAKADGGLYHAVRDAASRCVDGTPCTADADCAAVTLPPGAVGNQCVAAVEAFTGANPVGVAFINPQIQAAGHIAGLQGILDPDGPVLIQHDLGNGSAVATVPGLGILASLPPSSTEAGVGFFLDDDFSPIGAFRASLGYSNNGPNVPFIGGLILPQAAFDDPYRLWINIDEPQPPQAIPNNGFPTSDLAKTWGQEKEVTSLNRFFPSLFAGDTDFGDWYFPSSGLSVTSELNGGAGFGGLDSTPLSVGRNRPDIENLTQVAAVNVPVIAFGGTNGLTPTAASYKPFATSIGTCTAPSCNGSTPRLITDDPITPTFGGIPGGFEVYMQEGYAHIDVVTAEDDPSHNNVLAPLLAFLKRNTP